jgi:acetyl-CoA synthetase
MSDEALENLLHEDRVFPPSPEFAAQSNVTGEVYGEAAADRLGFWAGQARRLQWERPWSQVLDWSGAPFAKWFVGGRLNVAVNCVDRHVRAGLGDRTAIVFEPESGESESISYAELGRRVARAANALTDWGSVPGTGWRSTCR